MLSWGGAGGTGPRFDARRSARLGLSTRLLLLLLPLLLLLAVVPALVADALLLPVAVTFPVCVAAEGPLSLFPILLALPLTACYRGSLGQRRGGQIRQGGRLPLHPEKSRKLAQG